MHLLASIMMIVMTTSTFAAQKPDYAIVIHGGAGGTSQNKPWLAAREKVLSDALDAGTAILKKGGDSLDAVETVVKMLEDSPYFNAGKGAVVNAEGKHELDACIMDGRDRACGAVGGVRTIQNPIALARLVMTETKHVLLVTDGAEAFAKEMVDKHPQIKMVPNSYFDSNLSEPPKPSKMGTVGCVALDKQGNIAAATSTGGLTGKKFGRVGDTPIAGAGTFADNPTCGVSCTGVGEDFIRNAVAFSVSARMSLKGESLDDAVKTLLEDKAHPLDGGIIAIDKDGNIVMRFNTPSMARAAADSTGLRTINPGQE